MAPPKKMKKSKEDQMKSKGQKRKAKKWTGDKNREVHVLPVTVEPKDYETMKKEITKLRSITPAVLCDKYRLCMSTCRLIIGELEKENLIRPVVKHSRMLLYTTAVRK